MKDMKNLLIAVLTFLLAVSIYTQIVGMNKAKMIEYQICLSASVEGAEKAKIEKWIDYGKTACANYRPWM